MTPITLKNTPTQQENMHDPVALTFDVTGLGKAHQNCSYG